MKTLSGLFVVVVFAVISSVLRAVFGRESFVASAVMFFLVLGFVHYVFGSGRQWPRVLPAAVGCAAASTLIDRLF